MKKLIYTALFTVGAFTSLAQNILTAEDSLATNKLLKRVAIGGYAEAKVTYDMNAEKAEGNIGRAVLFVGSRFNKNISFYSEIEIENVRAGEGITGSEIALEQAT